jgi:hypothetical protein
MKKWSRTLLACSALILVTNAAALLGVTNNRSDIPESQLVLSQRELQQSTWNVGRENSGITLRLNWRFEQVEQKNYDYGVYSGQWGMPVWLNKAKMAELGFDVDNQVGTDESGRRRREVQSKEVLLVLELNGQAYQHQLQRSRQYAENEREQLDAIPNSDDHKRRTRNAEQSYLQEQNQNSRLFVIDAGLNLRKLRFNYPDQARYAIVHGLIRPSTMNDKNEVRIGGTISDLYGGTINVPLEYRQVFDNVISYEVTVAYGKRLEPWIVAASKVLAANQPATNYRK